MSGRYEQARRPSVRFSESSAGGGSRHNRSDSGVGSLSDYELHDADADRTERRRSVSITTLQLALERERDERLRNLDELSVALKDVEKWKKKAIDADNLRLDIQRQLTEAKAVLASSQGLANRVELLEQEIKDLQKEKKKLAETNNAQDEKIAKLRKKLEKYSVNDSPSPPLVIRGGSGGPDSTEKLKRRMSKSYKGNEAEKEKEKLRSRFDRSDQSDTSNSTGGKSSTRRRRDSTCYVEPMGQGAPRPQVPMPPSPTRQYSNYDAGQIPRSVHPTVHPTVTYAFDDPRDHRDHHEDGNYNIHPLPREVRR